MDKITAFNRTYTRLVRKAAAEFARDEAVEVALGDKWGLVGTMTALDEQVLTTIFVRCIDHAAKVEASRAREINSLGVPMWATLARYDAAPCVTPMPREASAPSKNEDYACGRCGDAGMGGSFPHVYEGACFECGRKAPREGGARPSKPHAVADWPSARMTACEGGCGAFVAWADGLCTECMKSHIDNLHISLLEHAAYKECIEFDGDVCETCSQINDEIDMAVSSLAAKEEQRVAA